MDVKSSSSGASSLSSAVHRHVAHRLDLTVAGVWSWEEWNLHINILEMKAVILAFNAFLDRFTGEPVVLTSDSTTIITYLRKQGGTVSKIICDLACEVVLWTEVHTVNVFIERQQRHSYFIS